MADLTILSDEQENNLAGSLLKNPLRLDTVREILSPEKIRLEPVRDLYNAMLSLKEQGIAIDTVTVGDELERHNNISKWGGRLGLSKLREDFRGDEPEAYAVRVKGYAAKREMAELFRKHAYGALNGREDYEVRDDAIRDLTNVETSNPKADRHLSDAKQTLSEFYDRVDRAATMHANNEEIDWIIPTGFVDLDNMYDGGIEKQDFVIVAGRPGTGKSSFLLTMARHVALTCKKRVLFCGLEMGNIQTVGRLVSMETGIPYGRITRGKLQEREWPIFTHAIETLDGIPLELNDMPSITVNQIRQTFRKIEATKGKVDLVMVDYLQLAGADGDYKIREQEVSSISRGLKMMAKEFDIPVVAAAQLSREGAKQNRKPILSDLRECGSLEQDCDSVWFLHQSAERTQKDMDNNRPVEYEMIAAKHRNGSVGSVPLLFMPERTKFESASKGYSVNA